MLCQAGKQTINIKLEAERCPAKNMKGGELEAERCPTNNIKLEAERCPANNARRETEGEREN